MNKYSKYLAPALALSMFAAVVLLASGQFDGSEQIAATSGNVEFVAPVDDYLVKAGGKIPLPNFLNEACPEGLPLPSAKFGQSLRCTDRPVPAWLALSSLRGERVGTTENDDPVGVTGISFGSDGVGVRGVINGNNSAAGVAVKASVYSTTGGYGFFQEGENANNFFEGFVHIGENSSVFPGTAQLTSKVVNSRDAIRGESDYGRGILGISSGNNLINSVGVLGTVTGIGVGVKGKAAANGSIAVLAEGSDTNDGLATHGFYQKGDKAKNNFEGTLNVTGPVTVGYTTAPSVHSSVAIQVEGGLRVYPSKDKPACTSSTNGTFWFDQGSVNEADSLFICVKNKNSTYSWRSLFDPS